MEGFMAEGRQVRTLREILARLRETYCGAIGYEVRAWAGSTCTCMGAKQSSCIA
jgi:2-oxoglutarate dehydrogenase complex dehydrogenase (E1) component-like enzyme